MSPTLFQIEVVTLCRFYYFNQHIVPIHFVLDQFSFDLHVELCVIFTGYHGEKTWQIISSLTHNLNAETWERLSRWVTERVTTHDL